MSNILQMVMPRTSQVTLEDFVQVLRRHIDTIFPNSICVGPTHHIWADISAELGGKKSSKAIYTDVKLNRNNVLSHLGISYERQNETVCEPVSSPRLNDLRFEISFSLAEWELMKVKDVRYHNKRNLTGKSYTIFEPGYGLLYFMVKSTRLQNCNVQLLIKGLKYSKAVKVKIIVKSKVIAHLVTVH